MDAVGHPQEMNQKRDFEEIFSTGAKESLEDCAFATFLRGGLGLCPRVPMSRQDAVIRAVKDLDQERSVTNEFL